MSFIHQGRQLKKAILPVVKFKLYTVLHEVTIKTHRIVLLLLSVFKRLQFRSLYLLSVQTSLCCPYGCCC